MENNTWHFSEEGGEIADINMVPLIDVVLLLLTLFLICTPLTLSSVNIQLPKEAGTPHVEDQYKKRVLYIDSMGQYILDGKSINRNHLSKLLQKNQKDRLTIKADKRVPYGFVMAAIAMAKSLGISQLGLITEHADNQISKP